MREYPPEWLLLISRSFRPYTSMHIVTGTSYPTVLEVIGGDLTFSRVDDIRSAFQASLLDHSGTLTLAESREFFQPFLHEVVISKGAYLPGLSVPPIIFQEGIFGVTGRSFSEQEGRVSIDLEGQDRSERVLSPLPGPFSMAAGIYTDSVIQSLIRLSYPDAQFAPDWPADPPDPDNPGQTIPLPGRHKAPAVNVDAEGDAWAKCRELAANAARELFVNYAGLFALVPVPTSTSGQVVWNYVDGQNAGHVDTTTTLRGDDIYQGVIVKGESEGIRGEAWDDNPASLTSRVRTRRARAKTITANVADTQQAIARAQSELAQELAGSEQITFTALQNAALEVGDLVNYRRDRVGINGNYIVNSISMPLDVTSLMSVTLGKH